MNLEIKVPDVTNGFFYLYLDGKDFATVYCEDFWDKAIELVKAVNPNSVLHNASKLQLLRYEYRWKTYLTKANDFRKMFNDLLQQITAEKETPLRLKNESPLPIM